MNPTYRLDIVKCSSLSLVSHLNTTIVFSSFGCYSPLYRHGEHSRVTLFLQGVCRLEEGVLVWEEVPVHFPPLEIVKPRQKIR